ncbi:MAG: type II toxin-antitoxin system VapC family toxin [Candidatus Caldarchaeum sp.]
MREIVYLDTSAIVKRYVDEPSCEFARSLYRKAYAGEVKLASSIWNVGEMLGVLDKAYTVGRINEGGHVVARRKFLNELNRQTRLGILTIIHLRTSILINSWKLIEKHHIYQADALQITSAKYVSADQIVVVDKKLHDVALREGLNAVYVG